MKEVTFLQKHSQKVLSWTSSPKIEDPGGRILSVLGVEQGGKRDGAWEGGGERRQMESRVLGFTTAPRAGRFSDFPPFSPSPTPLPPLSLVWAALRLHHSPVLHPVRGSAARWLALKSVSPGSNLHSTSY